MESDVDSLVGSGEDSEDELRDKDEVGQVYSFRNQQEDSDYDDGLDDDMKVHVLV